MVNEIAFEALVGSHNYNLNTKESDEDYAVFILPSFEDLYCNEYYSRADQITKNVDKSYHDIRKLVYYARKPNISTLQVLFSKSVVFHRDPVIESLCTKIFEMNHDIAESHLDKLYMSTMGMYRSDRKALDKSIELAEPNPKVAANAFRNLDFLLRLNRYKDFSLALSYENQDIHRKAIVSIKANEFDSDKEKYSNIIRILDEMESRCVKLEDYFTSKPTSDQSIENLDDLVCRLVKYGILI